MAMWQFKGGISLKKAALAVFIVTGLAACNTNNDAMDTRYNDAARPIGYYTNEAAQNRNDGFRLNDNDGPMTELLDQGFNGYNDERGTDRRNDMFSRGDVNYHGHLNSTDSRANPSYYTKYDGELAEAIAERASRVANVDDVRAVISGNNVLVAVDTNDRNNARVERDVIRNIRPICGDRNIQVVTDEGMFNRVRNIDNDLRDGGPKDQIDEHLRNLFDNMGDAFERPLNR
jgi:spore cortex protein